MEFTADVPVNDLIGLRGNYTYIDSKNFEGRQRPRVPKHLANLGVRLTPLDARLLINLNYRIARDTVDSSGEDMDNYGILDLSVSYSITDGLNIYGRVENALDEDYEVVPTYNTAGAAGYAGLRYRF